MSQPDLTSPNQFRRRPRAAGLVILAIAWFFAARLVADRSASGITLRFGQSSLQPLVMALFLLFLLVVGLLLMASAGRSDLRLRDLLSLPRRPSAGREWGLGVAVGWGAALLPVLALALSRSLNPQFTFSPRTLWLAFVGLVAIAVFSLAEEIIFRGYPYRRLIATIGTTGATIVMAILYGATIVVLFDFSWINFTVAALFSLLLSVAWQRTHGLWLSWGIHFAWKGSLAVLFGLPVAGLSVLSSVVESHPFGNPLLVGGGLGPEASIASALALLVALLIVGPITKDYAWNYTHAPIIPGGYPLDVKPPAAHAAMEQSAPPPPLVQILPSTPQSRSLNDPPV